MASYTTKSCIIQFSIYFSVLISRLSSAAAADDNDGDDVHVGDNVEDPAEQSKPDKSLIVSIIT